MLSVSRLIRLMVPLSVITPYIKRPRATVPSLSERRRGPSRVARRIRKGQSLVLLQRVGRRLVAGGKRAAGQALEVGQGCIPPPPRLLLLNGEKRRHLGVALCVHERRKVRPGLTHTPDLLHAAAVVNHELIPKRGAGGHAIAPGHVVKPQQVLLGREPRIVELRRHRSGILRDGVAAGSTAIEADARG